MTRKRIRNLGEEILERILPPVGPEREILALLTEGEREITLGEGYDLADVMNEADSLLLHSPD